jgi:hypothetical protein
MQELLVSAEGWEFGHQIGDHDWSLLLSLTTFIVLFFFLFRSRQLVSGSLTLLTVTRASLFEDFRGGRLDLAVSLALGDDSLAFGFDTSSHASGHLNLLVVDLLGVARFS